MYSLVQWNCFSLVSGCTWVSCINDVREPISLHQAVYKNKSRRLCQEDYYYCKNKSVQRHPLGSGTTKFQVTWFPKAHLRAKISLEPGPSRAKGCYWTTSARERAWRLLKTSSSLIGWFDGVSPWWAPLRRRTLYTLIFLELFQLASSQSGGGPGDVPRKKFSI